MKNKLTIISILVFLFFGSVVFLRQIPHIVMNGHLQFLYYRITNLQEYAKTHNCMFFPQHYKSEVETYLSVEVPKSKKEMDKIIKEADGLYENFLKNSSKKLSLQDYGQQLNDYESALDSVEFKVYADILDITDKYLLIPFGGYPTDWSGALAKCFYPYFEKYNVDDSQLIELGNYIEQKQNELNKISKKISDYKIPKDDITDMRLLYKFPKQGIYYYYYQIFNPLNYKKPEEVQYTMNNHYTIFVYSENYSSSDFETLTVYDENGAMLNNIFIKDEPGFMYDMIINGINLKPQYYIAGQKGCENNNYKGDCPDICKFSTKENSNLQIKYTINPLEKKIVKQMEFDNGPIVLGNICGYRGWIYNSTA